MKHNLLTAANGLQTPFERSQRKSTTSSIHSTLLTSLLALFLLMVGSSAAWADWYITGEALPGLEEWVGKDWKVNALPLNTKLTDNTTYYYCFQNVSASNDNRYRLKITNGDWGTQRTADNTSEAKGNVAIVTGQSGDNQISFKMPFDGDVYVFFNDGASNNEKVWIVAVPQNVAAAPNNSGNRRLKTDIMLSGSGWTSEGIKFAKNNDATTYKHVTSYILPATHDNDERDTKIRFEMYYNDNCYVSGKSSGARMSTSTPQRIIYLWNGDNGGAWIAYTLPTYPVRKSGWKLFVEDYNSGNATNLDANGEATVTLSGGSTYRFFIANTDQATTVSSYSSDIKSYPAVHGVNCFGGCYIDQNNSSNVSFTNREVYDHSKSGYGWFRHPVVAAQDLRGEFQVSGSGTKDVTFSFDGGKITINAVDHADVGPKYTVTLHPNNGGSNIVRNNVPEGSTASASELGLSSITYGNGTATWYTNEACTEPFTSVTGNMDLYAKWGVSGNYYIVGCLQTAPDGGDSGNWSNDLSRQMTYESGSSGKCSFTFIAPSGKYPFEIIKNQSWSEKINGGNYDGMFDNSISDVALSATGGHLMFELASPKKVTVSYNGKVSVKVENYTFDNSKTWRIKTSWGNGGAAWNYNTVMTNNSSTNATAILHNVPAGANSFIISTKTNDGDAQAVIGNETFNALYVDMTSPSTGLTWNTTSAKRDGSNNFNSTTPQSDGNYWRNCKFTLAEQSDIRISFDGGKIRCDIVAPNTVTFNSNGGSDIAPQEVPNGGTATEPSAPTKAGYAFVKWQLSGADYDFSSPVTEDITLDAVWAYKAVSSVALNESAHTTWVGNSDFVLTLTKNPSDLITKTVAWSSDAEGVATVSNGTVTAVSVGSATITCTVTDMNDNVRSATCEVTVAACEMATDNIYTMTVTGYNSFTGSSATLTGLWNSNEPATITKCKVRVGDIGGSQKYAVDNNGLLEAQDTGDDWLLIPAGKNGSDQQLYYIKNNSTNRYITFGERKNTGNWELYQTITTLSIDNEHITDYQFYEGQCGESRIVSMHGNCSGNYDINASTDFFLHRHNWNLNEWNLASPYVAVGKSDGCQSGNAYLRSAFTEKSSVPNPAYLASQMNTSYYRMNTNATVRANLANGLAYGSVITVRLYADAETSVKLQKTDGTEIATINLTADAELEYIYTVASNSALVGENAFVIKAADNHAGIASIEVSRMHAVSPSSPALTWDADLSGGVTQSVSGGTFQHEASSTLSSGAVHYTSSNTAVATVAADGTVTPHVAGSTTITATIEANGCYAEAYITYNVTLSESTLAELIDATDPNGTLTLTGNYNEDAVIDKAITIDAQGHSIGNLTVQTAGDLTLSSALTVNDFTICTNAGNSEHEAASGQVRNANYLTVNGNAYFLYTVDPSGTVHYGWYDFTVPFPVNAASGIKGIDGSGLKENFANGVDYAIMEYLGEKQGLGQYPYKKFSGVMQPNKLYSITLDSRDNYNTLRMQKTTEGALVAGDNVTLNAYAGDETHANWNGVGNGTLHHANAGVSGNYIQVYQSGDKTFLTVNKNEYSLVVGTAFMVQQEAGTMTLSQATHDKLLAPARQASAPATAIQIASEGQPFSDQLFISASETGGQAYTPGIDVAKAGNIGNVNVPQIWTNAYDTKLCVHEAQLINGEAQYNLSLYAPAAGTYTLTSLNIPTDYTLYLTQNGTTISELSETYTLDLSNGITTEYGLLLIESHKIPTSLENVQNDNVQCTKVLRNGVLYILHNGKVYNAQGGLME